MAYQIQLRRDLAANWTSVNPTLAQAELGYETDTNKLKIGDGATAWTSLSYFQGSGAYVPLSDLTVTATPNGVPQLNGAGQINVAQLPVDPVALLVPSSGSPPSSALGDDRDSALDVSLGAGTAGSLFTPKAGGAWPSIQTQFLNGNGVLSAIVGTSASLADNALTTLAGSTGSPGGALTLPIGLWEVWAFATLQQQDTTSANHCQIDWSVALGTAVGTIEGMPGTSSIFGAVPTGGYEFVTAPVQILCWVNVTTAGTVLFQYDKVPSGGGGTFPVVAKAQANSNGTNYGAASGIAALQLSS